MAQVYVIAYDHIIEVYSSPQKLLEGWKNYLSEYYKNPQRSFDSMVRYIEVNFQEYNERYNLSNEGKDDFIKFIRDEKYEGLFDIRILTEMEACACHIYTAIVDQRSTSQRIKPNIENLDSSK